MKNPSTGETDGPPLEHEKWIERQRKIEAEEADATANRGKPPLRKEPPVEEPVFAGKKLSEFDGLTDEQILAIDNVGTGTLAKIKTAQADRDAK